MDVREPMRPPTFDRSITPDKLVPQPSVGRIVHYQSYGSPGGEYKSEPRAAIITEVYPNPPEGEAHGDPCNAVSLAIMNPTGMFFTRAVPFAETPTPGHWNWPPYVPTK